MPTDARRPALAAALGALAGLAAACPRAEAPAPPPAPAPVVETATDAAFTLVRGGVRPAFSAGDRFVFVNPSEATVDDGLPGVSFGDARGPRYGLLGGYFAPRVLAPDTRRSYRVRITNHARGLRVAFDGGPDLEVLPSGQVILRGDATLTFPADDAEVQGTYRGQPAVAFTMRAGGEPRLTRRRADWLQVRSPTQGTFGLEAACPRWDVAKAVPRGSTSVFLLHLGPSGLPADPLYAPPEIPAPPPDRAACAATGTSTLSLPAPR